MLFELYKSPNKKVKVILAVLPFIIALVAYQMGSDFRLSENPRDKILPSFAQMADTFANLALVPDKRSGEIVLLSDIRASLTRLVSGFGIAAVVSLALGVFIGSYKGIYALTNPALTFLSMIPPLSLLPVLFIVLGVGETGKIGLIVLGVTPLITRDLILYIRSLPVELTVKAQTLGLNRFQIALKIMLPLTLPKLIDSVRLSLGAGWLFLIASEAIAAQAGLGYRIFLLRRYLAMDGIIPYVIVITTIGIALDLSLRLLLTKTSHWYSSQNG
ncbi:lipid kinase (plasmid) [Vibrio rotiferianus]|uniref:Lipid kinase n=1 Tax=Vibrio rotiferianus TaxID=190895 RepID=A0A510IF48_9VIBR|nr:ABC transporter permease subunit [Vibrio rotiferianus]BBL92404.1 lipid kinase [Vibrio rotiferianus]